jgi:hypothetical protein
MRNVLSLLAVAVILAFTTSAALAMGPSVDGAVSQKFTYSGEGTTLIAVDGTPYAVPLDFYLRVQLGDTVHFDGVNWTIVE